MVMERGVASASPPETYQQMAALHPMQRTGKVRGDSSSSPVAWLRSGIICHRTRCVGLL